MKGEVYVQTVNNLIPGRFKSLKFIKNFIGWYENKKSALKIPQLIFYAVAAFLFCRGLKETPLY